MLFAASYRYSSQMFYKIYAPPGATSAGAPQPHEFVTTQVAEVEDGRDRQATIQNILPANEVNYEVRIVGDRNWQKFPLWPPEWVEVPRDPLPFEPATYCESLAPDFDTSQAVGVPDVIDGLAVTRFGLHFPNNWSRRNPDYGPDHDVTRYIDGFVGSVWISEGSGFIAKMNIHGFGAYEDGTTLHIWINFEVRDLYDESIEIDPPAP
jgi:hypothetical protein